MIIFVLFFAFATSSILFVLGQNIFSDLYDFHQLRESKQAFLVSESLTEDVVYRMSFGTFSVDSVESLMFRDTVAYATTTYDSGDDLYLIDTQATLNNVLRKSYAELSLSTGDAFNYGLQAGNGGILVTGNSSIYGNVYSNGTVESSSNADIYGDVVSAGPTGLIQYIHATGSVWANTIGTVEVEGDAHYNNDLGGSLIGGTIYSPVVSTQPTTTLPISTTTIQEWKDSILDYGTIIASTSEACLSGEYEIDSNDSIGYLKIECDLIIDKNTTVLTLNGPVWVEGDLYFKSGPELRVNPSLGRRSVQIIVDDEYDSENSGRIIIENSTNFYGSGDDRSYIMLLSNNDSAEQGGSEVAIDIINSANGDVIMYSNTGLVDIANNIDLREVTGYQIKIANGSSVTYEEGLASLLFTSGPGGEYLIDDWQQAD